MLNKIAVKKRILRSLLFSSMWGGKHTEIKNLRKGLPSILTSTNKGKKIVDKALKEMINDQWILCKISTNEWHVSLNPRSKKEIMEFILK